MGDLSQLDRAGAVKIVGADASGNETQFADVELLAGKRRLLTDATVVVEELLGKDNQADVWFWIGGTHDVISVAAGDTVRVQIAAGGNATLFPAIDLTYTVTAADAAASNPEIAVADGIVAMLNGNATFADKWRAARVKDNSVVHIGSKLFGEFGERPNSGDFSVTVTGTITVLKAYDHVKARGKGTALQRDPNDPRIGVIGITGTVAQVAEGIGANFIENVKNAGSPMMNVNGAVTPVVFSLSVSATKDRFVSELRFYGSDNGIQFGKFLALVGALANGILIEVKADDNIFSFPVVKTTEDFKNKFASNANFQINIQAGLDQVVAIFEPDQPFPLRKAGTFAMDDYFRVTIRDDLTSITNLEMIAYGFERVP